MPPALGRIVQFAGVSPLVLLAFLSSAVAQAAGPAPLAWGPSVFAEAQRAGRPVLVLVSDPACARCRLDEAEALAEPDAARLLQRAFVVTRVDRYERPDLDDLLSTAVQWLSNERGHPLVVALLPDGRPYTGAARIAAADRGERPGLHRFALRAWSEFTHDRAGVEARAARAAQALARAQQASPGAAGSAAVVEAGLRGLEQSFDARLGGFGEGESFAPPAALRLLVSVLRRGEDVRARRMLERTLAAVTAADPPPETLARRALLLEAFASSAALVDPAPFRARAAALADGALRLRDAEGAFLAFEEPGAAPRVLAGWNGLMIGALALSATAFDRPQDLEAARTAARVVLDRLGPPARLRRTATDAAPAPLEDHAWLAEGLLRLDAALAGRERRWADAAAALVDAAVGSFYDAAQGGFFDSTAPGLFIPAALPPRLRNGYDGELPSANGVMAGVLRRLGRAMAQPRYEELARSTVDAFAEQVLRGPRGMEGLAAAAAEMETPPPAPGADVALPAADTLGGIRFAAEVEAGPSRLAGPVTARLRLTVPPGQFVVGHPPGARDLVGLSISVATPGVTVAGSVRYPPPRQLQGRWDSGMVNVLGGDAVVEVPLRLPADPARRPARIRLRAVFQACRDQAATCDRPQSIALDAPLAPASP
jgi:uncharacterized protein